MSSIQMIPPSSVLLNSSLSAQGSGAPSKDVASEFESLMIAQMLKQMRGSSEDGGLFPGDKSDTYGGMFDMYFGRFLSENGGLGLADFVNRGLEKSSGSQQSSSAAATNPPNTFKT